MFKNLTKGNKKEIEECQRKMKSSSENRKYLQQKIYFEWEKLDQINWCHYLVIISYELSSKNFPKVKLNILGDKYGKKHDYEIKI